MAELKNYREVGIFDLISAPLNPIGAFDAERFKKDVRDLLSSKSDEQFLAVDLTGLDFVYSDAYNAFIQFHEEMASRGGAFAILTNNKVIVDGLKKAGLDKKLRIFASEEDMMSFSLHAQTPMEESPAFASQNVSSQNATTIGNIFVADETEVVPPPHRQTGVHRRFTKSFNAITKEDKNQKKGLDVPFDEEPSSARTVIVVILLLLVAVGVTLALFYVK